MGFSNNACIMMSDGNFKLITEIKLEDSVMGFGKANGLEFEMFAIPENCKIKKNMSIY